MRPRPGLRQPAAGLVRIAALLAASLAVASQAAGAGQDAETLLAQIRQATGKIQTLAATFTSVKRVSFLKEPITSQGRLYYSREGRMRWEILSPYTLAMTYDGSQVNRYTQEQPGVWKLMVAQHDPVLAEVMKQLSHWLSGQAFAAHSLYQVEIRSRQPVRILLTPRSPEMRRMLKNLEFTFGRELNAVTRLVLTEGSGDTTTLEYHDLRLNQSLDPGLFP